MRRRSFLFVVIVSLTAVGWNVVTTRPSGSALAADPQAELAKTREQLADARSTQQSLAAALRKQRAELDQLRTRSAALDTQLDVARAQLAEVTAEYERVSGLLAEVKVDRAGLVREDPGRQPSRRGRATSQ